MTTPVTPADVRRPVRLKEATDLAYHLAHVVKEYPAASRDGFAAQHLDRIESVLAKASAALEEVLRDERDLVKIHATVEASHKVVIGAASPSPTALEAALDGVDLTVRKLPEPTIPPSLLEALRHRTDCD